jgi:hypothetical protein
VAAFFSFKARDHLQMIPNTPKVVGFDFNIYPGNSLLSRKDKRSVFAKQGAGLP